MSRLLVMKFETEWCAPCRMMRPIISELMQEHASVEWAVLDAEEELEAVQKYGIMSVPTLVFIKDDVEVARTIGYKTKKQLEEIISKNI